MINQTIAHYKITAKLGQGGMGEVYRATDTKLEREVAIKILPREICDDPARRKRFLKEAKAASSLNHPHVCVIYEVSETDDGRPFIAMEYLPGQTLGAFAHGKSLDNEQIVTIGSQIADALDAAMQAGIIHRDIKPENIHVDDQGWVKVLDFGLAKRMDRAPSADASTAEQTEPGKLMGTPSYMSPEQARGQDLDHRSDLFSAGIVLYQLTTGRLPFEGATLAETVEKISHTQPEAIARFNYEISPELERIIRKCLEKKPAERYQSARELLIDFRRLQRDSSTQEAVLSPKQKPWKTVATVAVVALIACLLLGIWWSQRDTLPLEAFRHGKSVAVLPFKFNSQDMASFADGLCEELANALGRLDEFDKIPPWSSSSTFRQDVLNKKQVAEAMQVSTLLEGSIERIDDHLHISATLVDPFHGRSGDIMWSETYDHNHNTALPFAIQDEIARSIVEKLRVKLEDDPNRQFVQRYTENPEAYDYYLKGRYNLNLRGAALEKAKRLFELALLCDSPTGLTEASGMAPAYVGLADVHFLRGFYGLAPIRSACENARRFVDRALQIDGHLAEAYASLGFIETMATNPVEAEAAFKRSLKLNDRNVSAIYWYAAYCNAIGDEDMGNKMANRALDLDSLSNFTRAVAAWQLGFFDPNAAIFEIDETLKRRPGFPLAHFVKGLALLNLKRDEEAHQSFQSAVVLSDGFPFYQASLALAQARTGRRSEALALLRELETATVVGPWQFSALAGAYLALGDKDRCYEILERSLVETYGFPWLTSAGTFDAIYTEPRFIDIVNRTGMTKYNDTTQQYEVNRLSAEQKANQ